MANRASSGYYRRNSYRRKKWRNILVILLSVAVVLLVVFLLVGNILKEKTSDMPEDTEPQIYTHQTTRPPYQLVSPSYNVNIKGRAVNIASDNLKDELGALSENGYNAASLNLSDEDGKLLFNSSVASRFGYPAKSDGIELASLIKKISSAGLKTSAVFSLNSFSEDDATIRSVMRACEAAIACEIAAAGVNDVLLRCPDIKAEYTDELISLAEQVKSINKKAIVGLVLTPEFLNGENVSVLTERIISSFDFIAFDLIELSEEKDSSEQIQTLLSTDKYYYILRYNMRVLLPTLTDEAESVKLYELMSSNNITNWQTVA